MTQEAKNGSGLWQWAAGILAVALMSLIGYTFGQRANADTLASQDKRITTLEVQQQYNKEALARIERSLYELSGKIDTLNKAQAVQGK